VLPPISPGRPHSDNGYGSASSGSANHGSGYLPEQPISLSKTEEADLLTRLSVSLRTQSMDILKTMYNELSVYDNNLAGLTDFNTFQDILYRCQVCYSYSIFISPQTCEFLSYYKDCYQDRTAFLVSMRIAVFRVLLLSAFTY